MKNNLINKIEQYDSIVILGHERPDGDCLGSTLAAYNYIRRNYPQKKCSVYLQPGDIKYAYLKGFNEIRHEVDTESYDLALILDASDKKRLAEFVKYMDEAKFTLNIDHHETNKGFTDELCLESDASSTCQVLYGYLEEDKLDIKIAECIYTGIIQDTGVFQYSNTSEKTMEIAGKMMKMGVDFSNIISKTFFSKTYTQQIIHACAMQKAVLHLNGKVMSTGLSADDMNTYGAKPVDLDGIVEELRNTEGVEASVFIYQLEDGRYKVSLRSTDYADVAVIAESLGGGGHIKAAGCTVEDPVKGLDYILKELEKQIR